MWKCWISPCLQSRYAVEGWALGPVVQSSQRVLDKHLIIEMELQLLLPTPTALKHTCDSQTLLQMRIWLNGTLLTASVLSELIPGPASLRLR